MLKIIVPLLAAFFLVPQALAISPADTEEILVVIEAYYDGMTRGDADVLDKVFHEDWHITSIDVANNSLVVVRIDKPSKRHLTGRWILAWATSRPFA